MMMKSGKGKMFKSKGTALSGSWTPSKMGKGKMMKSKKGMY
jgi:hypothetical protein